MHVFGQDVSFATAFFLLLALGLALSFEFVNGFHDTANAVATVMYTHTLKPAYAHLFVEYGAGAHFFGPLTRWRHWNRFCWTVIVIGILGWILAFWILHSI